MQTEPPTAVPPKRKRRWFQFSLRTLLIVVTLLAAICGIVTPEWKFASERAALIERTVAAGGIVGKSDAPLPNGPNWIQRALGDSVIEFIAAPALATDEELSQLRTMFPEAQIGLAPATKWTLIQNVHFDIFVPKPNRPTSSGANNADIRRFFFSREGSQSVGE
jgi:hypothetical protein